jgi:nitrogen fixation protein FixH
MVAESKQRGFVFTGWHMLLIMVLFFGTIISVNVFMAWNAVRTWSGLVVPNTYVASQQFNGKVEEAKRLAASGIDGDLVIKDGRVVYHVIDAKGAPVIADDVSATFKRPVDEREDFTLALIPVAAGQFVAERDIPAGQWVIDIATRHEGARVFHQTLRTVVAGAGK